MSDPSKAVLCTEHAGLKPRVLVLPNVTNMIVRSENSESAKERSVIRSVNEAAFGGAEEADLVTSTRIPVEDCHRSMYGYCVVTDGKYLLRSLSGSEPH